MRWNQHSAVSAKTARNYPQLCAFGETTVHWRSDLLAWLIGSFLTTSAISSIPFLDVTNSLLGRMDFRTAWGGRFELGASMSPIVMKRKTLLELRAAQTTSTAAILVQNKHTHTHTQMRYEEAWGFSEVEAETMTSSEMQRERQKKRSATSAFSRCEMRCPQLHTTAEIYNSWCHKEKNLYWYFFSLSLYNLEILNSHTMLSYRIKYACE